MTYLFVGERPSPTAAMKGLAWEDGKLCAKQLFDALRATGIDPSSHKYDNVFVADATGPEVVCPKAIRRIRRAHQAGLVVVCMGKKVGRVLAGLPGALHIVHPAARGHIRAKERYAFHIKEVLT